LNDPLGLHRTKILSITELWIRVETLEAIDGTPIILAMYGKT
jgi:tRNA (Thr-GGU) A37 N-methylase